MGGGNGGGGGRRGEEGREKRGETQHDDEPSEEPPMARRTATLIVIVAVASFRGILACVLGPPFQAQHLGVAHGAVIEIFERPAVPVVGTFARGGMVFLVAVIVARGDPWPPLHGRHCRLLLPRLRFIQTQEFNHGFLFLPVLLRVFGPMQRQSEPFLFTIAGRGRRFQPGDVRVEGCAAVEGEFAGYRDGVFKGSAVFKGVDYAPYRADCVGNRHT